MTKMTNIKWTTELLHVEALKFATRGEFSEGSSAYQTAYKRGVLDHICRHMVDVYTHWTPEDIQAEALKFSTRLEFKRGSKAYAAALKRGLLDSVCGHMLERNTWTTEAMLVEALKFSSRSAFSQESLAYSAAYKRGVLDSVCAHMDTRFLWTTEGIQAEALKFSTRDAFRRGSSAYSTARSRGILDSVCGHMVNARNGFDTTKSGTVYYLRFDVPNENSLYKIGITNSSASERLKGVCLKRSQIPSTVVREIWFEQGLEARDLEKVLHDEFLEYRYYGPPILASGNTELYTHDVLGWDK